MVGCVMALLPLGPASAQDAAPTGDEASPTQDGFSLHPEIKAAIGGVATGNTNFGAGTFRPDGEVDHDVAYGEGYLLPKIKLNYGSADAGTTYAAVAAVAAATRGGDPANFTFDSPSDVDLDQLYAGWRSGTLLSSLGDNAIDISVGRESFQVGDGFLISDGHFDSRGDAAFWLAPRLAFNMAGVVKIDTKPVGGSAFYLEGDGHQDHSELGGINLEYANDDFGTFGATYFNIFESDDRSFARDGMNVADLRAWDIPVPFVPDLKLRGEFAHEWGNDHGVQIDADGWYVSATYTLPDILAWKPTLTYRYSSFSGDSGSGRNTAFDPLFYYGPGVWGTWYQGEIVGEYLLFNSNEIAHMVQFEVTNPSETLTAGILFFDFSLDKDNYFGTSVSDKHFADEVNVYANWTVTPHIYLGVVGGLAWPGAAAKEAFGGNDTYELIEAQVVVTY
jgi:hypothetical protein